MLDSFAEPQPEKFVCTECKISHPIDGAQPIMINGVTPVCSDCDLRRLQKTIRNFALNSIRGA